MDLTSLEDKVIRELFEEEKARSKEPQLLSDNALREKVKLELGVIRENLSEKIVSGYLSLVKLYNDKNRDQLPANRMNIPFLKAGFFSEEILKQKGTRNLENYEESLAEYFNIESESFSDCYKLVMSLFEQKTYEEAVKILFFLNFICPASSEFLNAMGHAEYKLNQFDEAASLFLMAFSTNDSDPEPLKYAAYCFTRLGDEDSADECIALISKSHLEVPGGKIL
jgi:tetratricopeptide (TPR) repeat protein